MSAFISTPFLRPCTSSASVSNSFVCHHTALSVHSSQFKSSSFTPFTSFTAPKPLSSPVYPPTTIVTEAKATDTVAPPDVSTSRRAQIRRVIKNGPVFHTARLVLSTEEEEAEGCITDPSQTCLDDWINMGAILEDALGKQSNDVRVYQYYLPIFFWILRELQVHQLRIADDHLNKRPFILGFSCPQGGGKTTMTTFMQKLLRTANINVQIASLDDFYVTNKEQRRIAERNANNRLMQFRGMPGTHDLDLLNDTLDDLRHGRDVSIPRYDKTAFGGRGDRAPKKDWKHILESTDVVLLEGWCMGFEAVTDDEVILPDLKVVNDALKEFNSMYSRLDGLFIIEISNMEWVFDWRLQAERGTRAAGRPGLSDNQVIDFVSRFMPAYKQYSPQLYTRPTPLLPNHELHIEIDNQRRPVFRKRTRDQ